MHNLAARTGVRSIVPPRSSMRANAFLEPYSLTPPSWATELKAPKDGISLAMLPTPIHRWPVPGLPEGVELFIKRDDMTGMQMSGNKVRKLEFLMADAVARGCDSVITIGGIQSNHCRATATAARYLGLDAHLILRNGDLEADRDPGLVGNLLVERLQGAYVHQVTKQEYGKVGSEALTAKLEAQLKEAGKKPYVISVGGSNSLGCWGYMMAMEEIRNATADSAPFTHIAMACGSGATTGGLALANHLSGYGAKVLGFGVCDDEPYFYDFIGNLLTGLGSSVAAEEIVSMVQCKGAGYAISRDEELRTVLEVAESTGVVLDPVYTGKAVHALLNQIKSDPEQWRGSKVVFIHTGGLLGMYEKVPQLEQSVVDMGRCSRMQV